MMYGRVAVWQKAEREGTNVGVNAVENYIRCAAQTKEALETSPALGVLARDSLIVLLTDTARATDIAAGDVVIWDGHCYEVIAARQKINHYGIGTFDTYIFLK